MHTCYTYAYIYMYICVSLSLCMCIYIYIYMLTSETLQPFSCRLEDSFTASTARRVALSPDNVIIVVMIMK